VFLLRHDLDELSIRQWLPAVAFQRMLIAMESPNLLPAFGSFSVRRKWNVGNLSKEKLSIECFALGDVDDFVAVNAPKCALCLRSVCLLKAAFRGLRCHPPTCMLLKLRLSVDSSPT